MSDKSNKRPPSTPSGPEPAPKVYRREPPPPPPSFSPSNTRSAHPAPPVHGSAPTGSCAAPAPPRGDVFSSGSGPASHPLPASTALASASVPQPAHAHHDPSCVYPLYTQHPGSVVSTHTALSVDRAIRACENRANLSLLFEAVINAIPEKDRGAFSQGTRETRGAHVQHDTGLRAALEGTQDIHTLEALCAYVMKSSSALASNAVPVSRDTAAVAKAWTTPLEGCPEVPLYQTICNACSSMTSRNYANTIAVVQSSGTGKSRMVHEMSRFVFTIPFTCNAGPSPPAGHPVYPAPDLDVYKYLVAGALQRTKEEVELRYNCFLSVFFACARSWLVVNCTGMRYHQKVHAWNFFLADSRVEAYKAAVLHLERSNKACIVDATIELQALLKVLKGTHADQHPSTLNQVPPLFTRPFAKQRLDEAREAPDNTPELPPDLKATRVELVVYFDESHSLTNLVLAVDTSQATPEAVFQQRDADSPKSKDQPTVLWRSKTAYDILLSVLNRFIDVSSFFGIFLSTTSHITEFAPPAMLAPSERQAAAVSKHLQAPYTAVSFDCEPTLVSSKLDLDVVASITFMAKFGRPLFWTLLKAGWTEDSIATYASQKLVGRTDSTVRPAHLDDSDSVAVLDVRLCLDFAQRRNDPTSLQAKLISHHMRLVYTVPRHREFFISGYSSEPILANAAGEVMRAWMSDPEPKRWKPEEALSSQWQNGWIDLGTRGEVVGRLLLTLAYDRATSSSKSHFRNGCTVPEFLTALFAEQFAKEVLEASPDNVAPLQGHKPVPLSVAFKDSVIRFTHCVRLGDASGLTPIGLCAAFVRGMAFIGQTNQPLVDFIVPILLDRKQPISPDNMSALLVQFKRRLRQGGRNKYDFTVEELGLFEEAPGSRRPYITFVMELGVSSKAPSSPSKFIVPAGPTRSSPRSSSPNPHPRYNFRAYGCSNTVYQVIEAGAKDTYAALLANRSLLQDHPYDWTRAQIWNMKPLWVSGQQGDLTVNSYNWINVEEEEEEKKASRGDDAPDPRETVEVSVPFAEGAD
ncbi:hypothetical protein EXIGLDRAFT_836493 [Exidia glandulosa HHB12029]|uniref:Uncharacterized protein n=1 Tax=Exidia glandulosa HHB12029 TaxID=1314781 RepID=A0A165HS84_EXIGL|nr:hypothetical protein EXIGLDRAFT_836493 [Exidia glandulosa HHB12029]